MKLLLRRLFTRERATFGVLSLELEEPVCFTLEDLPRAVKIPKETCIPSGLYRVVLRKFGRMYETYRRRHPWNEPGMLWLQAVPQFTDILIHCGNTDEHTHGCILLGNSADVHRPSIANSVDAYRRVYQRVAPVIERGDSVWIEIADAKHMLAHSTQQQQEQATQ